jgi:Stress responsive A/B Barrel Domain
MEETLRMHFVKRALVVGCGLAALGLFASGYATGQGKFGQPKTVIHVVSIQWKQGVSEAEKEKVFDGVKQMAAAIPGVKNVWIKSDRVEPYGFDDGFAIEFRDAAAADAYAASPIHKSWNDLYLPLRASSVSIDVTNP